MSKSSRKINFTEKKKKQGNLVSRYLFGKANLFEDAGVLIFAKDLEKALPDLARFLAGVDAGPDTGGLVVSNNRRGLSVVGD